MIHIQTGCINRGSWACMAVMLLLCCPPLSAKRISRATSGTAPCAGDKAVRVLAIGGELQPNSWCGEEVTHRDNKGHIMPAQDQSQEREEYRKRKEVERTHKREQEKERDLRRQAELKKADEERRESEARKRQNEEVKRLKEAAAREHKCRGVGGGANCIEPNPGKGAK